MQHIYSTVQRIDEKLKQEAPDLAQEQKRRTDSGVWQLLSLLGSAPVMAVCMVGYFCWDTAMIAAFDLGDRPLSKPQFFLFVSIVASQVIGQFVAIQLLKLLWLHYTWLVALGTHLWRLWQREFPVPVVDAKSDAKSGANCEAKSDAGSEDLKEATNAHQTIVKLQRERLDTMLERYAHLQRVLLANDLRPNEQLLEENLTYLRQRGYQLASWGAPHHLNALQVCRGTDEATCVLF